MSTEQELKELKELMGLVGALAQDTALYMGNVVQINKVQTSAQALEDRLRALLAELDAAREDAARYCWLTDQSWFQFAFDRFDPDDHGRIDLFKLECARIIDAARKGEA